jgi:hypothetical protein
MTSFGPMTSTSSGALKQSFQAPPQPGFSPRPPNQQKQPTQAELEYIQVDTSYSNSQSQMPRKSQVNTGRAQLGRISEVSMKKGVLSQLIDKVRLKDDRKASGVSSSSSGGTIPKPPVIPSVSAARRALTMYDAQCQFGLDSSTSAVSALAVKSNQKRVIREHESRPTTSRAQKSFVKSKSDDERPPSKLSQQSRARSTGQLETETLLRSLSSGSCVNFLTFTFFLSHGYISFPKISFQAVKTLLESSNYTKVCQKQLFNKKIDSNSDSHIQTLFIPTLNKVLSVTVIINPATPPLWEQFHQKLPAIMVNPTA